MKMRSLHIMFVALSLTCGLTACASSTEKTATDGDYFASVDNADDSETEGSKDSTDKDSTDKVDDKPTATSTKERTKEPTPTPTPTPTVPPRPEGVPDYAPPGTGLKEIPPGTIDLTGKGIRSIHTDIADEGCDIYGEDEELNCAVTGTWEQEQIYGPKYIYGYLYPDHSVTSNGWYHCDGTMDFQDWPGYSNFGADKPALEIGQTIKLGNFICSRNVHTFACWSLTSGAGIMKTPDNTMHGFGNTKLDPWTDQFCTS